MLPILQLLDTCGQRPAANEKMTDLIKYLEDLLVHQVFLPLRDAILSPEPATDPEKESSLTSFGNTMVLLLRRSFPQLESPSPRADWKTDKHLALSMISLLFDNAIRCRPRSTPKLRRIENPWLEQLFIRLAKCAENLFPPASSVQAQKDYTRVIKWMLRKAVDHQVRLSLSTIEAILDQASGLFQDTDDTHTEIRADPEDDYQIEWRLVSLCILNDSDAFVVPSSSASDNETYAYRPPNKYLSTLLRTITDDMYYKSMEEDEYYDIKLLDVVIPLCNAFTGARDLTGFLEHWREQLNIAQERKRSNRACSDFAPSIWEDEKLISHVARSVESSLTAGQLSRVLSMATHDLAPSIPNVLSDQTMSLPSLIILDCMFMGLFKDETFVKLESIAMSVFNLLGVLINRPSLGSSPHDWRVWRIQAMITDRWLSLRDSSIFKHKAHPAICMASELINRISSELTLHHNVNLKQELYAFKFVLKFAAMEDSFWGGMQFSSRQITLSLVTKILNTMEPFCHRISHDHFGTMMRTGDISQPEQSYPIISPIDKFYFDCIDEIIESPDILR